MKPRKLLRSVYTLQYDRRTDAWTLLAGNTVVAVYIHYDIAVHSAARTCRDLAKLGHLAAGRGATHHLCTQLRIRRKNGRWARERTYGFDPTRRRG